MRPRPTCDLPIYREIGGGYMFKTLVKNGHIRFNRYNPFRPPMFPVGDTRRWKKENAIFLCETLTFTGNFIVSRGTDILIRLEIEYSFIQLSNDILIGPHSAMFCCLTQNVARFLFPICTRLCHECNQTMLVFMTIMTVNLVADLEPYL